MIQVREATKADIKEITDIYNEAVLTTTATFDTEPKSLKDRLEWFADRPPRYPVLVAEADGRLVGWAALNPISSRPGWRYTAEDSVYVQADARGRGMGKVLLSRLIERARSLGFHVLVGRIVSDNESSIRLHAGLGFEVVGRQPEVGRKFDKWIDLVTMQLIFNPGEPPTNASVEGLRNGTGKEREQKR